MGNRVTESEFDSRITIYNRAVRVDPFKGVGVKIKFRCLQHDEVHLAKPTTILRGHGLRCCNPTYIKNKKAKEEFDKRINSLGRVRRVGEYTSMHKKILFYCLEHNETHLAFPRAVIRGQGLICCGSLREAARRAKETFDSRIAKLGRVERIGEYVDCNTKILFRCLRHNEVHMSTPSSIISGNGLVCCRSSGSDNLSDLITGKKDSNG